MGGWERVMKGPCAGRARGCVCVFEDEYGAEAEAALKAAVKVSSAATVDDAEHSVEEDEEKVVDTGLPVLCEDAHELAMLSVITKQPETFPMWRTLHQPTIRTYAADDEAEEECRRASVVLNPIVNALRHVPFESPKAVDDSVVSQTECVVSCDQDETTTLAQTQSDTNSNISSITDDIFLRVNPPLTDNYLKVFDYGHILSKLSGN
jgi:hypothetical protein